jgi:hypothetical protein
LRNELRRFSLALVHIDNSYKEIQANIATRDMQQRIIMLRVSHTVLLGYSTFLSAIGGLHNTFLQHLSDPGRTTVTSALLQIMSKDSYFWEQIHHVITGFVVAVGTLLDVSNLIEAGDLPKVRGFRELLIEIRGICIALDKSSESISTRLRSAEVYRSWKKPSGIVWVMDFECACCHIFAALSSIFSS